MTGTLTLYSIHQGRQMFEPIHIRTDAGGISHSIYLANYPSGTYFLSLEGGGRKEIQHVILLK